MSAYQPSKRHPLALTLIVAGHGAVLAALMLSKMEVPAIDPIKRLIVDHIDAPKAPPPPPRKIEPQPKVQPSQTESVLDRVVTPIPSPNPVPAVPVPPAPPPIPIPDVPLGDRTVLPPPPVPALPLPPAPAPDPVRVEAARDPRYADAFQPPYPDSMRSQGEEGSAVVRVLIGTDGRVKAVEEVNATHGPFMAATLRHARARWRFRPATVDGKPVESWKRMTVTFTLENA